LITIRGYRRRFPQVNSWKFGQEEFLKGFPKEAFNTIFNRSFERKNSFSFQRQREGNFEFEISTRILPNIGLFHLEEHNTLLKKRVVPLSRFNPFKETGFPIYLKGSSLKL